MKEYVLRITAREGLGETILLEFGFDAKRPVALVDGVRQIADLIEILKTPEAAAKFAMMNSQVKVLEGR